MASLRQDNLPEYGKFNHMKDRCYSPSKNESKPTYVGCTVDPRWKNDFSRFLTDYRGMHGYGLPNRHIDKDILVKGNKVYGPDTCVLVPAEINAALNVRKRNRGNLPAGVHLRKGKYDASIGKYGKKVHLGRFENPYDAFLAYKEAKEIYLKELADKYKDEIDPRVYEALYNWVVAIND